MELNRRDFLKGSALFGGAAAMGAFVGCDNKPVIGEGEPAGNAALPKGITQAFLNESVVELEPITTFAEEAEFDIVVVGAGTAGVPAVLTALEEGATVACLQKESTAQGNGNGSGCVILEESNELGVLMYKQAWRAAGSYRINDDLLELYVRHSGETAMWMLERAETAGAKTFTTTVTDNTYDDGAAVCRAVLKSFGPKPRNHSHLMQELAAFAEGKGAKFYYSTPAVQLVKGADGAITGVIGKNDAGYVKLSAKKAVIVAAGDYQNNEAMIAEFSPDVAPFGRKQNNRTGDGHLMTIAAGGVMAPVGHAKTMHDMDAQPMLMTGYPFMALDQAGHRFMNEDIPMASWDCTLHDHHAGLDDPGRFFRIFDDAYETKYNVKAAPAKKSGLENYIKDASGKPVKENPTGVYTSLIDTFRADTLDELAKMLGLDAATLKAEVEKWNKACVEGDLAFGLSASKMKPIDTPPYYGTRQWIRCSAINSGVMVNGNCQVLDGDGNVIKGLYSVGSGAGDICGDHEWNLTVGGLCCGSYMTMGRYAALHAVNGKLESKNPAKFEDCKRFWTK